MWSQHHLSMTKSHLSKHRMLGAIGVDEIFGIETAEDRRRMAPGGERLERRPVGVAELLAVRAEASADAQRSLSDASSARMPSTCDCFSASAELSAAVAEREQRKDSRT